MSVARVETLFPHRDNLLTELIVDAYNNSGAAMEQADLSAQRRGDGPGARLLAAARGLRAWSLDNRDDFSLIYGSPVPGYDAPPETVGPASRTPGVLADIVRAALSSGCLRAPARAFSGPPLVNEAAVVLFRGSPEPPYSDLIERGIVLWSSLIGMLIFEVFSRTHDSVRDQARFFDFSVAVAAESVGLVVPDLGVHRILVQAPPDPGSLA